MSNAMDNILSIEMGQMVLDSETPSNCLIILTKRAKYCFRLSETFPVEKQIAIFKQFVTDVQTPEQTPEPEFKETEEKHDGAKLFDVPPSAPTDVEIEVQPTVEVATQD